MRVLLVGPDFEDNLSLRYLSGALRAAGHEAELAAFRSPEDQGAVVAAAAGFDLVGLSMAFQVRAREYLALARALKAAGARVVVGGHWASCTAEELLRRHEEVDLVALHEAERTLVEVADVGGDPARLAEIPGLAYRSGGEVVRTAPRPMVADLDSLPWPDRRGPAHLFAGVPTAYVLGSRGCLSRCDYCCISTLHAMAPGPRLRRRDPERVADEMADLYHRRGIRQFIFHDDTFLGPTAEASLRRLDALERAFGARGLARIGLVIKCRPGDARREVLARLRAMGLVRVFLGVESSTAAGLRSIGRRQVVEESEAGLEACRDLGVSAQYTIMCFHPEATAETLRADLAFLRRHDRFGLNVCRVEAYAGTPLEARLLAEGRARGDYLARTYRITDPAADLACRHALRILRERCWVMGGLMERTIGLGHLGAVVERFYDGRRAEELRRQIDAFVLDSNHDLIALLEDLLEACLGGARVDETVAELAAREAFGRAALVARHRALVEALNGWARGQVGLGRVSAPRPSGAILGRGVARHAAAVALAVSAACGGPQGVDRHGISEYAAVPIGDADGDGLSGACELSQFGTNPDQADTDGDGVLDGDEDSDGDGLTNREETDQAPPGTCQDVQPPRSELIEDEGISEFAAPPLDDEKGSGEPR